MFHLNPVSRGLLILLAGLTMIILTMAALVKGQPATSPSADIVTTNGSYLLRNGQPFTIHGMNYYAQDDAWEAFWLNYGETAVSNQINAELDTAKSLNVNTVRLFTPYRLFSGTIATAYPAHLADFVTRLEQRNMVAIVTFFDFYPINATAPYQPSNYTADKLHIDTVLNALGADNPTILAWDIKNEMDRDYATYTSTTVKTWANEMITYTRSIDPNHLITIGFYGVTTGTLCYDAGVTDTDVFDSAPIIEMSTAVDIISFHYYLSERCYEGAIQALQAAIGDKPLILQEFGLHTNSTVAPPHTETEQAAYYNALLSLSEAYDLAGTLFWTLNDFTAVPSGFGSPDTEKCLGILRNSSVDCDIANADNYSHKPATQVVRHHYQDRIAYIDLFNGLVGSTTDAPPAGWSDNYTQGGGLLRGYNPSNPLWSHNTGQVAFSKFVSNTVSITGIATSPILTDVDLDRFPLLTGRVSSYTIRDATFGKDSILHIGVQEGGQITRLLTVLPTTPLPFTFHLDLRHPPLNWTGTHSFQIVLELEPETEDGYSATYELDWLAIEEYRLYLPFVTN